MAKAAATKKAPTKSEVYATVADATGLSKKEVAGVVDALGDVMKKSLKKNGQFTLHGLCKLTVKKNPAKKARKGINPFTGEEQMFKAKPASKKVKVRALKALNDAL